MYINNFQFNILQDNELDEDSLLKRENIQIKTRCFASKYGLKNIVEDMNEVSKLGVWAIELSYYDYARFGVTKPISYDFSIKIISRIEKQEIIKKNYSFSRPHACLFFEIPIVRMFDEEKVKEWQIWCFNKLKLEIEKNKKIRDIWLRKKNLMKDFEENEKEPK